MKLNEICEVYSGYALKSFNDIEDGLPVVKIGNILTDGTLNLEECQYTTDSVNQKYYSQKGDIYIALSGATTGKIGIMDAGKRYVINQRVGIVRQKSDDIPQEYIKYFLLRQTDRILQEAAGCAQPNISPKQIAQYVISETSKEKMQKICGVLNGIKKIIDSQKAEISALDNLIKARFVEMFGNPVTNEKRWKQKLLGEITTKIGSGATPKGGKSAYQENGITLIRSMNVHNGMFEYKELAHISDEQATKLDNVVIEENDVLLNITGASVARSCVVPNKILPARVNQHVCIIRCKECIIPEFLNKLLIDDNYQKLLWGIAGAGATREAITKQQVESLQIIMPPVELQNQFTDFVNQVDKSKF